MTPKRIASLVGVDAYPSIPLTGCVADAIALQALLTRNADGSANFHCRELVNGSVTREALRQRVEQLFSQRDVEMALFFFSGHGFRKDYGGQSEGVLVTVDTTEHEPGVPMEWVIAQANNSPALERVIILDCCHAGAVDQVLATRTPVALTEGVSILAGCRSEQYAKEHAGRGVFTSLVCAALEGGAADVRGFVTTASMYAYVDQILTPWDQRPLFKTNVAGLRPMRRGNQAVGDDLLREITTFFPTADFEYPLDRSYEPTEEPRHPENEATFEKLQRLRDAHLLETVGTAHMYYAAMENKACRLTPLGRAYWHQVRNQRF